MNYPVQTIRLDDFFGIAVNILIVPFELSIP